MIKIAIANFKGGVGKTTTTINLAFAFQRMGYRVIVVDHDPQGNATSGFGLSTIDETRTLYEALIDMDGLPLYKISEGILLCPSDVRLASVENDLHGVKGRLLRLRTLLEREDANYDIALIDSPPNHGIGSNSALMAVDEVLVPVEASLFSIKGLKEMLQTIDTAQKYNKTLHLLGLVITRYRRTNDHDSIQAELRERYPELVCETVIRESASVSMAQLNRSDVVEVAAKSIGADDYTRLGEEVARKLNLKY